MTYKALLAISAFCLQLQFCSEVARAITVEAMRDIAFAKCQAPYQEPLLVPVPELDPPSNGAPESIGLVYAEELAITSKEIFNYDGFYAVARPRAAVNTLPMEIFIGDRDGNDTPLTWDKAKIDYSSSEIQPPIDVAKLPLAGRTLTELIIGHEAPDKSFPQLFDIRSSAYLRFAGYPINGVPQISGASLRLAAHRIFGQKNRGASAKEDFPVIRSISLSPMDRNKTRAILLVESDLFCGALAVDMIEGQDATLEVDGFWYTRRDFKWREDRHTGLAAYSSMVFKTELDTPNVSTDEAHDSDKFRVRGQDGATVTVKLQPPPSGLSIRDFSRIGRRGAKDMTQPAEWTLSNEDRDPSHYSDFAAALGETNYDRRVSYRVEILDASHRMGVSLYQHSPDGEYGDNIVAVSTLRQNIKKAEKPKDFVHFKYRTVSYR